MQDKVMDYVRQYSDVDATVLDIGSYDVNGSLRDLFHHYTGLDMREGPNVDIVSSSHAIPLPDESFDIITCVDMLEHDSNPFQTIQEIWRLLRIGGRCIIAVPGLYFPLHEYPSDYWRFTPHGVGVLMEPFINVVVTENDQEVFGTGLKGAF